MKGQADILLQNRFTINGFQYSFIGYRLMFLKSLIDGTETWQDVPEHFGRFYPCSIELPSEKISLLGEGLWYVKQLEQIIANNPIEYRIESKLPVEPASNLIFVNCLDPIFGHALYKLSSAQALTEKFPNNNIVVLVTANMLPYTTFSQYYIAIKENPSKLLYPGRNLNTFFQQLQSTYHNSTWAFCNTSRQDGQQKLPGEIAFLPGEPTYLTFIHRNDRCWGGNLAIQVRRVNKVFSAIKKMNPGIKTVVIGVEQKQLEYNADLVVLHKGHGTDFEKDLANISNQSACVFGVHGSNMLVPSYYAQTTVELLPNTRLGNFSQAYWPNPKKTAIEVVFTYRVLYGDHFLLNVFPKKLVHIIDHLIKGFPQFKLRSMDAVLMKPFSNKID